MKILSDIIFGSVDLNSAEVNVFFKKASANFTFKTKGMRKAFDFNNFLNGATVDSDESEEEDN